MADGARPVGVVANGGQHVAEGRIDDAAGEEKPQEEDDRDQRIHAAVAVEGIIEGADVNFRLGHIGEAVLAAGDGGERRVLQEEEHLGEGDRDHRQIDAGAAEREQADDQTDEGGADRAHGQSQEDVRDLVGDEQVGSDEAAGAVKRRLAEREQAGVAEDEVEAEAEQAPDQDAAQHVGVGADLGQHEGRNDQDCGENDETGEAAVEFLHRVPNSPCGRATSTSAMAANSITAE
jgi:hypothetical protein